MKNLFIESKEWFDRVNGNSYFSSRIEIDGKLVAILPFQYGYGSHSENVAAKKLHELGFNDKNYSYPSFFRDDDVVVNIAMHDKCLKREVTAWGIE